MKFKVNEGMHIQNGIRYVKGQVVESNTDLIKAFPQKFTRVSEAEPTPDRAADIAKLEAKSAAAKKRVPVDEEEDEFKLAKPAPKTHAAHKSGK